jgi:hypothetical protein
MATHSVESEEKITAAAGELKIAHAELLPAWALWQDIKNTQYAWEMLLECAVMENSLNTGEHEETVKHISEVIEQGISAALAHVSIF